MDLIFILPVLILILLALYLLFQGAIYVPSNEKAINAIIKMAKLKKGSKIADLGSGDGRIVIAFARSGIQAHGFEINPFLVLFSRWNIKKEKLTDRASIHWQDFWKINLLKGTMKFKDYLKEEFKNKEFKKAFDEEEIYASLAIQTAKIRQKGGLTQKELAKRLHTTQQTVSRLENIHNRSYSLRTLIELAQALDKRLKIEFV